MNDNSFVSDCCKSPLVQTKEWVEVNTGKTMGTVSDNEIQDNWCPVCEKHCKIIDNESNNSN